MNKYFCVILLFAVLLAVSGPAAAETVLNAADHGSLSAALASVPENAGDVTILLSPGLSGPEKPVLSLPAERGMSSLRIAAADGVEKLSLSGIERICANGIPLTLGAGIYLENTSIYGGGCVSGTESSLSSSSVTVEGAVGFVFGGGFAENGGTAAVAEPSVTVTEKGLVYYEIFGGGHAYGSGSRVFSEKTTVSLQGTTDYALGAGYAEDGGRSECEETSMIMSETADVEVALFSGGSASGEGSVSETANAKAVLSGKARWAFSGDFAFGGGVTRLTGASRLEILESGNSENAFLGSFASDPGSDASVNTSELMNCGTVDLITKDSQSTDNGKAKTLIPALFTCESGN